MANDAGSIKIGDDKITINIGGNAFEASVTRINNLGINPGNGREKHRL